MANTKKVSEVVEEVKASITKDTIDKIKRTLEYILAPLCGVFLIWGLDYTVYITAGIGVLISILSFIELFIKE